MINKNVFTHIMLSFLLLLGASAANAANGPITCAIQTYTGHYVTAVGGGNRSTDVVHTDATRIGAWEKFTLIDTAEGGPYIRYGIRVMSGHYLSAIGGGGRITDVIHSNREQLLDWEKFTLIPLGYGWYAIQTVSGHYLNAVGGGGRITDVMHSDATQINNWEKFKFICGF